MDGSDQSIAVLNGGKWSEYCDTEWREVIRVLRYWMEGSDQSIAILNGGNWSEYHGTKWWEMITVLRYYAGGGEWSNLNLSPFISAVEFPGDFFTLQVNTALYFDQTLDFVLPLSSWRRKHRLSPKYRVRRMFYCYQTTHELGWW